MKIYVYYHELKIFSMLFFKKYQNLKIINKLFLVFYVV
ncbi:hypothetical protein A4U88_2388 [Serratia marcescens]|nr:hypothetical protein A4U88_2388 [Serratia marcescens]